MLPPQGGPGNGNGNRPGFNPAPNAGQNTPSFPPGYGEVGFDEDQIRSFIRENMTQKAQNDRRDGPNNGGGPGLGGPGLGGPKQDPFRIEDGPFNR